MKIFAHKHPICCMYMYNVIIDSESLKFPECTFCKYCVFITDMGRRLPDGALLSKWKWVVQVYYNCMYVNARLPLAGRLIKQTTAAADWSVYLLSGCSRPYSVFAVQAWSNLWDLIWEPPSHYSMQQNLNRPDSSTIRPGNSAVWRPRLSATRYFIFISPTREHFSKL